MNNGLKVTVYNNILDVNSTKYYHVDNVLDSIISGGKDNAVSKIVEKIRSAESAESYDQLKKSLPAVSFSGMFSRRGDKYCISHSGLVCLDFDKLGNDFDSYRNKLIADEYTFALFTSPSGTGLKVLVKIPPSVEEHKYYCLGLKDYYQSKYLDTSGFDLSRLCFMSYDPELYQNTESKVFIKKVYVKEVIDVKVKSNTEAITNTVAIYEYLLKWLTKKEQFAEGNRHNFIVKLAGAANRFGIDPEYVKQKMIFDYASGSFSEHDIISAVNSIYKCYTHNFATQTFTKDIEPEENIYSADMPLTDIFQAQDLRDQMLYRFENGIAMGETTYFDNVDEFFRWKRGQFNVFTGIGNHGKSTFLNQLLLMKSLKEGTRWGVYSPEQYPAYDYFDDLIHSLVGKNILKQYSNRMSASEYTQALEWINEKFLFIYPEVEMPTPDYIFGKFKTLIQKGLIDGCIIDPYNQLDHDYRNQSREDLYISQFILKAKRFIQTTDVYFAIIIHPKAIAEKTKSGSYKCPDVFDLSGGSMWNNKADNIYVIHKDRRDTNEMLIKSLKIKKKNLTGRHGESVMTFNYGTNRLYFQGESPLDCIENPFFKQKGDDNVPF